MDVGAQLRQAREARRLSIGAVAATTRIHARVLEAIERNDATRLPARPYARGFVAAYAREVGLDADATVRAFFAQFETESVAVAAPEPAAPSAEPDRRRLWVAAVGAIALIATASMLWRPDSRGQADAVTPVAVGTSGTAPAPGDPTIGAAAAAQSPSPTAQSVSPSAPAAERATRAGSADVVVILTAERASWIAATADGKRVLYEVVQPGATHTLRATEALSLRVGDAGAVRWSVNGAKPTAMGRDGEVRTATLTAGSR